MPIVNCPWQGCRFNVLDSEEEKFLCTKKDDEEIILLVNEKDQEEGANCTSFEWGESTINLNQKGG